MPLSVHQVGDTRIRSENPKEDYTKIFKDIAKHFEEHAERYAENAIDVHAGMKIVIDLPVSELITIEIKTTEYLKGEYK